MPSFKVLVLILASFTACMIASKAEKKCKGNRDDEHAYVMCVFDVKPDADPDEFMEDPDYLDEYEQRNLTLCYGRSIGYVTDNGTLIEDNLLRHLNNARASNETKAELVEAGSNCCNSYYSPTESDCEMNRTIEILNCVSHEIFRICFT